MLNTKVKQIEMDTIQQEPLFTDLKPEEASVVEGGAYFKSTVSFDASLSSRKFYVKPGGNIFLSATTKNSSSKNNKLYGVKVFNTDTRKSTPIKYLNVGNDSERWRGMQGGNYKLIFEDTPDFNAVNGSILVSYDS